MTTDPFTEAASDKANARYGTAGNREVWMEAAEWARTHLAAQEPTGAEVEAAAERMFTTASNAAANDETWQKASEHTKDWWRMIALAALRPARRDEAVERRAVALFTDSESWRFAYATQATSWDDLDDSSKEMFRNLARRDEEKR